jgi:NADH dehydrogenase
MPRCSISAGGKFRGALAWMLWALIHVYLLTGFQHRLLVAIQWLWRYLTYERGSRLIAEYPQRENQQHVQTEP